MEQHRRRLVFGYIVTGKHATNPSNDQPAEWLNEEKAWNIMSMLLGQREPMVMQDVVITRNDMTWTFAWTHRFEE